MLIDEEIRINISSEYHQTKLVSNIPKISQKEKISPFDTKMDKKQQINNQNNQPENDLQMDYNGQYLQHIINKISEVDLNLIKIIDLSNCNLQGIPRQICNCINLQEFKADDNQLDKLPKTFTNLKNIQVISLNKNNFEIIPSEIYEIGLQLKQLSLSFNKIENVDYDIQILQNIVVLKLNNNYITDLPTNIYLLEKLQFFYLEWFQYLKPPRTLEQTRNSIDSGLDILLGICREQNLNQINYISFPNFLEIANKDPINFSIKDTKGLTRLHYSSYYGEIGIIKCILSNSKNIIDQQDNKGITALCMAILQNQREAVIYLLKNGANPNIGGGEFGSPLHIAVYQLNYVLVKELLKYNATVESCDNNGNSPMHILFQNFQKDLKNSKLIGQVLIDSGLNPNIKNNEGWSPLHIAIQLYLKNAVKWAIKYNKKANQNQKLKGKIFNLGVAGPSQETPLMIAVQEGLLEISQMLLENGGFVQYEENLPDFQYITTKKLFKKFEKSWFLSYFRIHLKNLPITNKQNQLIKQQFIQGKQFQSQINDKLLVRSASAQQMHYVQNKKDIYQKIPEPSKNNDWDDRNTEEFKSDIDEIPESNNDQIFYDLKNQIDNQKKEDEIFLGKNLLGESLFKSGHVPFINTSSSNVQKIELKIQFNQNFRIFKHNSSILENIKILPVLNNLQLVQLNFDVFKKQLSDIMENILNKDLYLSNRLLYLKKLKEINLNIYMFFQQFLSILNIDIDSQQAKNQLYKSYEQLLKEIGEEKNKDIPHYTQTLYNFSNIELAENTVNNILLSLDWKDQEDSIIAQACFDYIQTIQQKNIELVLQQKISGFQDQNINQINLYESLQILSRLHTLKCKNKYKKKYFTPFCNRNFKIEY